MISKIKSGKIANVKFLMGMFLAICLFAAVGCSQKKLTKSQSGQGNSAQIQEKIYEQVEQMPEYPGGEAALREYLVKSVKYPFEAMKNKIQGKVFVMFVVGKDGSVKNVKIARGVDPLLDAEAFRVVNGMPKWTPGKQKGIEVAVQYTIPINFALN